MKEYEITFTYLNGCAGAAYPQRSFEEAELSDPADYVRRKHGRDFDKFRAVLYNASCSEENMDD